MHFLTSTIRHVFLTFFSGPSNLFPLRFAATLRSYFNFSREQKNPGSLTAPGYLTLGHTVSYDTKFILLSVVCDYSITVATRPDHTVRPPSRLEVLKISLFSVIFVSLLSCIANFLRYIFILFTF